MTSYIARGTGTVFARSDASPRATWLAFQAAPFLSDHQHLDAGHFELVRGGDALLVDPGGYGAGSSLAHNVLLVDDGGAVLKFAPNQTPERSRASVLRFSDNDVVYALADLTSAYEPSDPDDKRRALTRAVREILFARESDPPRLLIHDRVTVGDPRWGVTFAFHASGEVTTPGANVVRVTSGDSQAIVTTVLPAGAPTQIVNEPRTPKRDVYWYGDDPADGIHATRVEIGSPRGNLERAFVHAVIVGARSASLPPAAPLTGPEGIDGAIIGDAAFAFAQRPELGHLAYTALGTQHQFVAGVPPRSTWSRTITRDGAGCRIVLVRGGGRAASDAGLMTFDIDASTCLSK
jgi:hypothetical protein